MEAIDKMINLFITKDFPDSDSNTEELEDWILDYLLPLDGYVGSIIIKHKKRLDIEIKDLEIIINDIKVADMKLNIIYGKLSSEDLRKFKYIKEYMADIRCIIDGMIVAQQSK